MSDIKAPKYTHFKDVFAAILEGNTPSVLEFSPEMQAEIQAAPSFDAGCSLVKKHTYHWTHMFLTNDFTLSLQAFMDKMVYFYTMHDLFRLRTARASGELVSSGESETALYEKLLGAQNASMGTLRKLVKDSVKIAHAPTLGDYTPAIPPNAGATT